MKLSVRWVAILALISCSMPAQMSIGQSVSKPTVALSPLALQQARDRVHELEQKIDQVLSALQPLAPKDTFESTATYNQRKQDYENPKEVLALKMEISKLRGDLYDPGIASAPVFGTYDDYARTLIVLLSGGSRFFIVPDGEAKQMKENWTHLSLAEGYSDAGPSQDNGGLMLVWNGNIYRETVVNPNTDTIPIGRGGASAPSCPLPKAEPNYPKAAKKAHIQGTVSLDAVLAKNGIMDAVKVLQGLGYGLDEEAAKFVAKYFKCKPGLFNGLPVATRVRFDVNFHLY